MFSGFEPRRGGGAGEAAEPRAESSLCSWKKNLPGFQTLPGSFPGPASRPCKLLTAPGDEHKLLHGEMFAPGDELLIEKWWKKGKMVTNAVRPQKCISSRGRGDPPGWKMSSVNNKYLIYPLIRIKWQRLELPCDGGR